MQISLNLSQTTQHATSMTRDSKRKPATPLEVKLARMRKAIAAGADVNGLDYSLPKGHREGRLLHACLRTTHMAGNATFSCNDQVIKFLLDHGADPRLCADNAAMFVSPLEVATWAAEVEHQTERGMEFYRRIVAMIKEAVVKLEQKEKAEADETNSSGTGQEQPT